ALFTPAVTFTSFFFILTPTTEIYTLSLHVALPISPGRCRASGLARQVGTSRSATAAPGRCRALGLAGQIGTSRSATTPPGRCRRSEEHTSELQSLAYLVCRLLPEKKKERHEPTFLT